MPLSVRVNSQGGRQSGQREQWERAESVYKYLVGALLWLGMADG